MLVCPMNKLGDRENCYGMKTPTINSEHVADIAVDSGRIYISYPCRLDNLDLDKMRQRVDNNPHMAVLPSLRYTVVSTGTSDGLFP